MKFPVFDLHCDTALALLGQSRRECGSLLQNELHMDLQRASKLDGYAQCFACFTTTDEMEGPRVSPVQLFEREMASVLREVERHQDKIRLAYSAADIEKNLSEGIMSAILTIEGTAGFGHDPELLEDLYNVGFRISSLGWNEMNPLTGSCVTGGGLTEQGKAYVKAAQAVGMLIDVSHISDEGFWDIMDITQAPILATHSNSRHVLAHSRNLTDDMFRKICETGGVAGVNLYSEFLGDNADIDTVCDHIFHYMEIDPDGKHIALGGDLDGCDKLAAGIEGIEDYPKLSNRLLERGLTPQNVQDIFWNNAFGVMK